MLNMYDFRYTYAHTDCLLCGYVRGWISKKKYPDVKLHPGKFDDEPGKNVPPNNINRSESMKLLTRKPINTAIYSTYLICWSAFATYSRRYSMNVPWDTPISNLLSKSRPVSESPRLSRTRESSNCCLLATFVMWFNAPNVRNQKCFFSRVMIFSDSSSEIFSLFSSFIFFEALR